MRLITDMKDKRITLSHGAGGKLMHNLIEEIFKRHFSNPLLDIFDDASVFPSLPEKEICFTTDSYTVQPIFFPGGDIGKLAICGTVNDLSVSGAKPFYISVSFIIEEGFEIEKLERIVISMKKASEEADVKIITGDTKVVEKGKADKIFINTSGIGFKKKSLLLGRDFIKEGDVIIINGNIGEHGLAVIKERKGIEFDAEIESDCAPLNKMIEEIIEDGAKIKFMRDPTRGGIATTLNEIVEGKNFGIILYEEKIPAGENVKSLCEILGFDPLYIANEGKVIIVAERKDADKIINKMRKNTYGRKAEIIGEVVGKPTGKVLLKTEIGSTRIIDMPAGELFPRIC